MTDPSARSLLLGRVADFGDRAIQGHGRPTAVVKDDPPLLKRCLNPPERLVPQGRGSAALKVVDGVFTHATDFSQVSLRHSQHAPCGHDVFWYQLHFFVDFVGDSAIVVVAFTQLAGRFLFRRLCSSNLPTIPYTVSKV